MRAGALVVCGVLCVLELTWNSADVLSRFEQYPRQDYLDFYDETSAAVEYTEHLDEGARMEKTFQRSYNRPHAAGISRCFPFWFHTGLCQHRLAVRHGLFGFERLPVRRDRLWRER